MRHQPDEAWKVLSTVAAHHGVYYDYENHHARDLVACRMCGSRIDNPPLLPAQSSEDYDAQRDRSIEVAKFQLRHNPGCVWVLSKELMRQLAIEEARKREMAKPTPERCGHECDCDSIEQHDEAIEQSRREFLANPGSPPNDWSPERVARTRRVIDRERERDALRAALFDWVCAHGQTSNGRTLTIDGALSVFERHVASKAPKP